MKKVVMICLAVLLSAWTHAAAYGGGSGTPESPYEIGTPGHWQTLIGTSLDWDKHFILTADLDFGGSTISPVGTFTGVMDGQGFVLRDVIINEPSSDNVGIFGYVGSTGQIRNLGAEQINITGNSSVGGLVGDNHGGILTACYSTGVVSGTERVGGLVGGLAGMVTGVNINNCYSTCSVNGSNKVGGLVGGNSGAMPGKSEYCFSSGAISGTGIDIGGLVGDAVSTATFSFWDVQASGQATSGQGTGLPTAAMMNPQSFLRAFWDFKGEMANGTNDYWVMPANGGYPILAWQVDDSSAPANDEMSDAITIASGSSVAGSSDGAMGVDITTNGYNDCADVWYSFDCAQSGNFTATVQGADFDTTLAVLDEAQREIVFNEDFFGGKSAVILKAESGQRYYMRVAGHDGSMGNFTISIQPGAVQAIQGDLDYDGVVDLVDFSIMAENWLVGMDM